MIATDKDLNPLDEGFHTVIQWDGEPDGFIRRMHTPNGLLAECASPEAPNGFAAALDAREYVCKHLDPDHVRLIPAGSTIRFDRDFVDAWDRNILSGCHHRSLDVSSLMEAFRAWNPDALPVLESTTDHRVMHCLNDTMRYANAMKGLLCSIG